jgi:hypothetical protein
MDLAQPLRSLHVSGQQLSCLIEANSLRFDRAVVATWLCEGSLFVRTSADARELADDVTSVVANARQLQSVQCTAGSRVAMGAACTPVQLSYVHCHGFSTFSVDPLLTGWAAPHLTLKLAEHSTASLGTEPLADVSLSLSGNSHVLSVATRNCVAVEAEIGCSITEMPQVLTAASRLRGFLTIEEAMRKGRAANRAELGAEQARCSSPPPPVFSRGLALPLSPGPIYTSECLICTDPATWCAMPCRHALMCARCWKQRTDTPNVCPMCRTHVQNYSRPCAVACSQ